MIAAEGGTSTASPFQFLDYFKEVDSVRFAGREHDIAEVVARATADRTFVLYGRSGLGKTSLLLAGVFPQLKRRGFLPIHIRLLGDPQRDLRQVVAECAGESADRPLEELLEALRPDEGVILVFDQFEEFFIGQRDKPEQRRAFIKQLVSLLDGPLPIRMVFSLREEFLAEMDDLGQFLPEILGNMYRLRPLTAFGARQAIIAPLRHAEIEFSEELVRGLVDLVAKVDFDPLLLQIACNEVYLEAVRAERATRLETSDLANIGGIDGLFSRFLSHAVRQVEEGRLVLSRAILDALITSESTKRALPLEALLDNSDFRASREEVESVLDALQEQRLLRPDPRHGRIWYELAHDRLVPPILEWFRLDEDFTNFRSARKFVTDNSGNDFRSQLAMLLAPEQFRLVQHFRERLRMTPIQQEFMFRSAVITGASTEDLRYWATSMGIEKCADVLKTLLSHKDHEVKAAASRGIRALDEHCRALAGDCLRLAFESSDPAVRREAGRALARVAGDEERRQIRRLLWSRRQRVRAFELLGDFADEGRPLTGFGSWARLRAIWKSRGRKLDAARADVVFRTRRGAVVGLLTGLAVAATTGSFIILAFLWSDVSIDWWPRYLEQIQTLALVSLGVGAYLGWRFARSAARDAAGHVEGRWFRAAIRVWSGPVVLALAAALSEGADLRAILGNAVLLATLLLAVPFACAVAYLGFARAAIWPPVSRAHVIVLGLAAGFAPSAAIALLLISLRQTAGLSPSDAFVFGIAAFGIGLISAVGLVTLGDGVHIRPLSSLVRERPRLRWTLQRLVIAICAASVPAYLLIAGTGKVPFLAPAVEAGHGIDLPGPNQRRFLNVVGLGSESQWLMAEDLPPGADLRVIDGAARYGAEPTGVVLLAAPERQLVVVEGPSEPSVLKPKLVPIPILPKSGDLVLSADVGTPIVLRFTRPAGQAKPTGLVEWTGEWTGRVSAGDAFVNKVSMQFPADSFSSAVTMRAELAEFAHRPNVQEVYIPAAPAVVRYRAASSTTTMTGEPVLSGGRKLVVDVASDGTFHFALKLTWRPGEGGPTLGQGRTVPVMIQLPVIASINNAALMHYTRAQEYLERRDYINAEAALQQAVSNDPQNPLYWNDLAWSQVALAMTTSSPLAAGALQYAKDATARVPDNLAYLDTLAHAAYLSGEWLTAARAWDRIEAVSKGTHVDTDPLCKNDSELHARARNQAGR